MQELGIIADGALLIENGLITEVGTSRRIENLNAARRAQEIDATGKVVMPGFVDSSTQLAALPKRCDVVHWLHLALAHGTTTVEIRAGDGAEEAAEAKTFRLLAGLREEGWDIISTYHGAADRLPSVARRQWASFVSVQCAEDAAAARELGLAVEFEAAGLDDDLAESSAVVTLLPTARSAARRLIEQGVAVALASGFHPCAASTLSMPMVMALAAQLTPAEAITAATINGAHALRVAGRTGSLEFGKEANLVIFDAADYRDIVRHIGMNQVRLTMRRGEVVYRSAQGGGVQ